MYLFCGQFLSINIMSVRFVYVVTYTNVVCCLFLCPVLLHLSTTVYLSVLLVDGHLDCLQFMTTINRSVVNLSLLW